MAELIRSAVIAMELSGDELKAVKRNAFLGSAPQPGKWTGAGGFIYEVVGRQPDARFDSVVEFFVKAWMPNGKQRLVFGPNKVGIERFQIVNIPVLTPDPLGGVEPSGSLDPVSLVTLYRPKLTEDILLTARTLLEQAVAVTGIPDDGNGMLDKIGQTTAVVYPSLDGYVQRTSVTEVWATILAGAGNVVNTAGSARGPGARAFTSGSTYNALDRIKMCFDTSVIPAGSTKSAASIVLTGATTKLNGLGSPTVDITQGGGATNSIVVGDFGATGTYQTVFGSITYAAWSSSLGNTYNLNQAGIDNVIAGGISIFASRIGWDTATGGTPSWISNAQTYLYHYLSEQTGTSQDPTLTVTYTAPSAGHVDKQIPRRVGKRWEYFWRT